MPSAGMKTADDGALIFEIPSEVEGRDVFLDAQQLRRHSISKNSTRSCALSARCFSHSSICRKSLSSSSAAAELVTRTGSRLFLAFFGLANSSSSFVTGNGSLPSAAIRAISSFFAIVRRASRSCSTSLMASCICASSSWTPTNWYRAANASCSRFMLRSFSASRSVCAIFSRLREDFNSSCILTIADWLLKDSLRARRISFSHNACVCACVSFARP